MHIINNDDYLNKEIDDCEVILSTYVDKKASKYYLNLQTVAIPLKFLLYTGATCNIVPLSIIKELNLVTKIKWSHETLCTFNGYKMKSWIDLHYSATDWIANIKSTFISLMHLYTDYRN